MKTRKFLFIAAALSLPTLGLIAGESSQSVSGSTERVPSSPATEEDIGDIQPATEDDIAPPKFRAAVQGMAEFVTNAKMQGDHSSGDVLWLPTVEVGWTAPIGRKVSLDLMVKSESILYSDYVERSFFGFSGAATVDYRPYENWPRVYGAVEPYWYQSLDTGDQFASAVGLVVGTDHGIPFNRGLSLLFWGGRYANYQASPSNDDRNQYRLVIGVNHQFRPMLYGQVFYTWQYSDYYNNGTRADSRHALGASMTYQFTTSLFGSVSAGFVDNDSSHPLASYQGATAALSLTWQF